MCQQHNTSLLLSLSSLCSPHDRPIKSKTGIEARNTTLFRKPADREDGRLKSQNNHLTLVWMAGSSLKQRGRGGEEVK